MGRKTSFYYSFLVLPAAQRRAIEAVWDFCRAVDDAVDEPSAELPSRDAVGFWRAELARCYAGAAPETPQGRGLQPFLSQLDLPRQAFEGVRMRARARLLRSGHCGASGRRSVTPGRRRNHARGVLRDAPADRAPRL